MELPRQPASPPPQTPLCCACACWLRVLGETNKQTNKQVVCEELGIDDLSEVFEWINLQEPIGSASISQVRYCSCSCVNVHVCLGVNVCV